MATAATSLLGLALPVTGELSGTWGDTVNVSITALLDTAVAGTTTLSSDADVTLTTTTLAANQARQAIILWTAGGTVTRTITVPAQSKSYIVINKTSSSQSIKIVGVGPTTGVTIVAGTAAFVVWNGVDFVTASVTSTTGILPVANGGTGLSSGTSGGVLAYTATGTLASSAALAASALVIGGGAGAAPSTTTTGTGVVTALGVNVGSAGAFVVNGGALGTPSSGTVTNLTGTASININGTVGATTPGTGAFTTLTASSTLTVTGAGSIEGLTVGRGAGAVSTNTAVGASALAANQAGGTNNTAIGNAALDANTTGDANTAVGDDALGANTTASNNTAVGYQAGYSNTIGVDNVAVGQQALYLNTDGNRSTAVGRYALRASNGGYNDAFGAFALETNTTGTANTAFGYSSLNLNSTGSNNVASGYQALASNTASQNTAVGYQAGYTNSAGQNLVAIGYQAGYTSNANNSTYVGYYAGQTTTGTLNTFVGVNGVGYLVSSGAKNTIIGGYSGNQGGLDIRTASNYIVLSDGDGNPRAYWNGANATFAGGLTGGTSGTGYSFSGSAPATSLTLDSSGNLGLGVTPSAWGSSFKAFQIPSGALWSYVNFATGLTENAYYDTGWKYTATGYYAASYQLNNGEHQWHKAPSGTAGNAISFTQAMTLDSSGNLLVGVATANANGGVLQLKSGITFPATAVAATDANTLDDYEEGTFTPTVIGTTTAGTASYSYNSGSYTKIGNLVTISFYIAWSSGTGTGDFRIAGLPFTTANSNNIGALTLGYVSNLTLTALNYATSRVAVNSTQIIFEQTPVGGGATSAIAYDATAELVVSGSYFV